MIFPLLPAAANGNGFVGQWKWSVGFDEVVNSSCVGGESSGHNELVVGRLSRLFLCKVEVFYNYSELHDAR